eukprot:1072308-Amphidinium_carterae.1
MITTAKVAVDIFVAESFLASLPVFCIHQQPKQTVLKLACQINLELLQCSCSRFEFRWERKFDELGLTVVKPYPQKHGRPQICESAKE